MDGFVNKIKLVNISIAELSNAFSSGKSGKSGISGVIDGFKSAKNAMSNSLTKSDISNIQAYNAQLDAGVTTQTAWYRTMQSSSKAAQDLVIDANGCKVSMEGLTASANTSKLALIGTKVATMALNAALSVGLAIAIQAVVAWLDDLVHAAKKASEAADENASKSKEKVQAAKEEVQQLDELIAKYKELANSDVSVVRDSSIKLGKCTKKQTHPLSKLIGQRVCRIYIYERSGI